MRILVDTNILIDYLSEREPYRKLGEIIINACAEETIDGCIAAHTVPNLFYILRKQFTIHERKELLKELCTLFEVVEIDSIKIMEALKDDGFEDFEDALQMQCALKYDTDYIVTRNPKDFKGSRIKIIEPEAFIQKCLNL